ncbi:hypothetical protein D3C85_1487210 [compost metagenome]
MFRRACSISLSAAVSVTSISRRLAANPLSRTIAVSLSTKSPCINEKPLMFTATGTSSRPASINARLSAQARVTTQVLSADIKPFCSAKGINTSGETCPYGPSCQRNKASRPVIRCGAFSSN